jgi:hypothetical protein
VNKAPKLWDGAKDGWKSFWNGSGKHRKPKKPKHAKPKVSAHPFGKGWLTRAKDWPPAAREYLQKSLRENYEAWKGILTKYRDHPATLERKLREAGGPIKTIKEKLLKLTAGSAGVASTAQDGVDVVKMLVDVFKLATWGMDSLDKTLSPRP